MSRAPRPWNYGEWIDDQRTDDSDPLVCGEPLTLRTGQPQAKLRKPWGEIIVERGRFAVYTRRCDHWRRIYHGSWHFREHAQKSLREEIKREFAHYREELERYENLKRQAAQSAQGDALRG